MGHCAPETHRCSQAGVLRIRTSRVSALVWSCSLLYFITAIHCLARGRCLAAFWRLFGWHYRMRSVVLPGCQRDEGWDLPARQPDTAGQADQGSERAVSLPASSSKRNPSLPRPVPAYLSLSNFSHINETQSIQLSDQALTQSYSTVCCRRTLDHRSHSTTRKRPRRKRKQRFATREPHQNHRPINTRTRATSHVE